MLKILTLLCITTKTLCQDAMEPDVKYGDQNDRFDVGALIQHSKAYFNDEPSYKSRFDQSRIEDSMRPDDDVVDALPQRRSGIESNRREMGGLLNNLPQKVSRRAGDGLTRVISLRRSRRPEGGLADGIPQRRSSRAEDVLADGIPQMSSTRRENGLTDIQAQSQYRRAEDSLTNGVPESQHRSAQSNLADSIPQRRQDYAYHDKMDPDKDPKRADYEENLKAYAKKKIRDGRKFKKIIADLHAGKIYRSRRSDDKGPNEFIDPDLEIMLQHAVPINAKFQGYLTAPLVE